MTRNNRKISGSSQPQDIEAEFAEWWKSYPLKVAKQAAIKSYLRARREASAEELRDGVARYIAAKPEWQCYCHPATWLNQQRWLDEAPTPITAEDPDDKWRRRLADFKRNGFWIEFWGPKPPQGGCYAPLPLLYEYGFRP